MEELVWVMEDIRDLLKEIKNEIKEFKDDLKKIQGSGSYNSISDIWKKLDDIYFDIPK